jgi:hypothetical protein
MIRLAGDIHHPSALAAAGEAQIGHQRFAWPVHDAADNGERDRLGDVGQARFELVHRFDDVEALPRA